MSTTKIELHRGDVVLIAFPFIAEGHLQRKRRPAVVVQADRYNQRREAVVIAAMTGSQGHKQLASKVFVRKNTPAGRQGGLRLEVWSTVRPWPPYPGTKSWRA